MKSDITRSFARIASRTSLAISVLCAIGATVTTSANAAGPTREECIAAADDGQKLRDDGKLSAARDKFTLCSAKACPAVIAKTCAGWREDADRDIPTATFRVTDDHGKELLDVKIAIDAATDAQPVSAKAISLDPGEHTVHVRRGRWPIDRSEIPTSTRRKKPNDRSDASGARRRDAGHQRRPRAQPKSIRQARRLPSPAPRLGRTRSRSSGRRNRRHLRHHGEQRHERREVAKLRAQLSRRRRRTASTRS